ncbi:MAG: lysophospholipid acyltransferase family protein [Enhygromyxa sp.]
MHHFDIDDVDQRDPAFIERFADLLQPLLRCYFRPDIQGIERIPDGAGLYVGNHNACLLTPDTFVWGLALLRERGIDDLPYGLGHELAISFPGLRNLLLPLGAIRASHDNAARLFAADRKVLVYPGSEYDAMRPYRDRDRVKFGPRRGYLRLALRHGVPVIPVVAAGAHETLLIIDDCPWLARLIRADKWLRLKTWPLAVSVPWGLTLGPVPPHLPLPTRIFVEFLEPIQFDRSGEQAANDPDYIEACHHRVLETMQTGLERVAKRRLVAGGKLLL